MSTLILSFQGPAHLARSALVGLLQRYRSAYFEERSSTVYAVTADDAIAGELSRLPGWAAARS